MCVLMRIRVFSTTIPGIEDIACSEVESLLGCRSEPGVGRIFFEAGTESIYLLNLGARTLHKIMIQLCREKFQSLEDIYRIAVNTDYTWIIDPDQTFAIRSERVGTHDFTSVDVARVAGQAVIDSFKQATGTRLRVNLDEPDVEIYCLVREDEFLMGINTTGASLHRRGYRAYYHPAAIKPTLASAMIQMSGWNPSEPLIDPMCGGATILVEAALKARNMAPNLSRQDFPLLKLKIFSEEELRKIREKMLAQEKKETFEIYGMEKYRHHLEGGVNNAKSAGVIETIKLRLGDATKPQDYPDVDFKFIVVNPPYGLRMNPREGTKKLYEGFLRALRERTQDATLVTITTASRRFREAAEKTEVPIMEERKILHGRLPVTVFKCEIPQMN